MMTRNRWLVLAPVVLLLGALSGRALFSPLVTRGEDRRIMDTNARDLEDKLGYHLYAPTWLPYEGRVGSLGVRSGKHRILQDYSDKQSRSVCILAQERRSKDRDRYHSRIFEKRSEAKGDINGKPGYFVTGSNGERRLFWNESDSALILSSCVLTDEELLLTAAKVR